MANKHPSHDRGDNTIINPANPVGPHIWEIRWARDLMTVGIVVGLILLGYHLRGIFTPVLIGLFLAYLAHPLITAAEVRRRMPRPLTISLLILVFVLIAGGLAVWLGPLLKDQVVELAQKLPGYLQTLSDRIGERYNIDMTRITAQIDQEVKRIQQDPAGTIMTTLSAAFAGTGDVAGYIGSIFGTTLYVVITVALIPIYFFFFAWQFGPMIRSVQQYLPHSRRDRALEILGRMDTAVAAFFRSRLLVALIMGILFSTGWWFANVPYAFLLGMAAGVMSLIPFLCAVAWPIAILLKWLETAGAAGMGFDVWAILIWPSVVYVVVQCIEGWVLTPFIQGRQLEMSPVAIIIVVFIGGALGGLYGLILCIPIAACLKILAREVLLPNVHRWAQEH